jgi:hypothetical protein
VSITAGDLDEVDLSASGSEVGEGGGDFGFVVPVGGAEVGEDVEAWICGGVSGEEIACGIESGNRGGGAVGAGEVSESGDEFLYEGGVEDAIGDDGAFGI